MIAAITLLADALHETARMLSDSRQRLRVVAARLVEDGEDPAPLFPASGELDCALVSLGLGEQVDALRLLVCRPLQCAGAPASATLAATMANAIAMKLIGWTGAAVAFTTLAAPVGAWPRVVGQAVVGIRSPASSIGVVVAEFGEARCPVLACMVGDDHAAIAQWVPITSIKGV